MVTKRVCIPFRDADRVKPYIAAVKAAGVEATALSVEGQPDLGDASGLLLMGGTDIDPQRYGQTGNEHVDQPDQLRDEAEWRLLAQALERDLPVLAICRGMQLLNVFLSGTLIQHLGSTRHDTSFEDKSTVAHEVAIDPASRLARIVQANPLPVNSRHHQAVGRVGKGLQVSAWDVLDPDVIEGLEDPARRFLIAVQWHPEDQAPGRADQRRLFEEFARAL